MSRLGDVKGLNLSPMAMQAVGVCLGYRGIHDKVRSFRIQKQTPFIAFKEEVAKEFGIPVQFQRFWIWAKRQNHTYRSNRPLLPQEEAQTGDHYEYPKIYDALSPSSSMDFLRRK
ncbi:hypothetical protein ACOSQ3_006476 [Xanthoceras sorbifolium]